MTGAPADRTLREAAARLGHKFQRPALLDQALTHPSASSTARPDNQRLEFLGDRVLGLVIAEALIARYPAEAEGALAPRLNDLVRKETCADIARQLGVDGWLRLGKSESQTGGRRKITLLGDAMEAIIAAAYLDGGMDAARALILRHWASAIEAQGTDAPKNAKSALQEWAQGRGLPPPVYEVLSHSGPDHAPVFTIRASLASGQQTTAEAKSKRAAENTAALQLLTKIGSPI